MTISDSCGAWAGRVFQVYRGSGRRLATAHDYVKISVRRASPLSHIKRGYKSRAVVVRVRSASIRADGSHVQLQDNSVVLLKKRLTPRGKELVGPMTFGMRRRKFSASFLGLI